MVQQIQQFVYDKLNMTQDEAEQEMQKLEELKSLKKTRNSTPLEENESRLQQKITEVSNSYSIQIDQLLANLKKIESYITGQVDQPTLIPDVQSEADQYFQSIQDQIQALLQNQADLQSKLSLANEKENEQEQIIIELRKRERESNLFLKRQSDENTQLQAIKLKLQNQIGNQSRQLEECKQQEIQQNAEIAHLKQQLYIEKNQKEQIVQQQEKQLKQKIKEMEGNMRKSSVLEKKIIKLEEEYANERSTSINLKKQLESQNGNDQEKEFETEFIKAKNNQLEQLCQQQLVEIEQLNTQKYEFLEQIKQLKQYEERVLTKEEVGSIASSDSNDPLEELHNKILALEKEVESLKAENEQLSEDNRQMRERFRQSVKVRSTTIVQKPKQYWDLEIVGKGNSLVSLIKQCWSFNFKNKECEIMSYFSQVSLFSFDALAILRFIENHMVGPDQQLNLNCNLFSYETVYLKTVNPKSNPNSSPVKKMTMKVNIPKQFLLLAKVLYPYQENSFEKMQPNFQNGYDLNEFWLKYAFFQSGVIVFIATEKDNDFIEYLCKLQESNEFKSQILIINEGDEFDQKLWRKLEQLQFGMVDENEFQVRDRMAYRGRIEKQTTDQIVMHNQKEQMNAIENLREYILHSKDHFFQSECTEPDFEMHSSESGEQFFLQLLLGEKAKLNLNRKLQYESEMAMSNHEVAGDQVTLQVQFNGSVKECEASVTRSGSDQSHLILRSFVEDVSRVYSWILPYGLKNKDIKVDQQGKMVRVVLQKN